MKKGTTLIEILVTSLILVIAVTGLLYTFVFCHRMIVENHHRTNAMLIINEHLEAIQNRESPTAVLSYVSNYASPKPVLTSSSSEMSSDYVMSMRIDGILYPDLPHNPAADLMIVNITVTWNGGGPNRTLSVSSITNEPSTTTI